MSDFRHPCTQYVCTIIYSQGTPDAPIETKAGRFLLFHLKGSLPLCQVLLSLLLGHTRTGRPLVLDREPLHLLLRRQVRGRTHFSTTNASKHGRRR